MKQTLKPGIHSQLYRAASGYATNKPGWLKVAPEHGVVGVVEHGFVDDLTPRRYGAYKEEHVKAGLQSGCAFGFGDLRDVEHAKVMARKVADVARLADYCVVDGEGLWEDDALDVAKVSAFYEEFRARAPDVYLIDQPPARPIPGKHGSPLWILTAKWVDARGPMWYSNNLRFRGVRAGVMGLGDDAYERIWPDYEHDWNTIVPRRSAALGVVPDKLVPTIQAYHWVFDTLVDALLRYDTLIMWQENHGRAQRCFEQDDWTVGPYPP